MCGNQNLTWFFRKSSPRVVKSSVLKSPALVSTLSSVYYLLLLAQSKGQKRRKIMEINSPATQLNIHTSTHCSYAFLFTRELFKPEGGEMDRTNRERGRMRKRGMLGNERGPEWKGKITSCYKWIAVECYWQLNDTAANTCSDIDVRVSPCRACWTE